MVQQFIKLKYFSFFLNTDKLFIRISCLWEEKKVIYKKYETKDVSPFIFENSVHTALTKITFRRRKIVIIKKVNLVEIHNLK